MSNARLTWLGHASFRLDSPGGKRIYIDPFLNGNPTCPDGEKTPERVDVIAVTHGHGDHVGDTVDLANQHGCPVVALVELGGWIGKQGVDQSQLNTPNKGGTVNVDGVEFTLVNAFHSGSTPDGSYGGEPSGIVVTLEDGTVVYFAGDTCVFGDMQLIGRIYEPSVAVIPIGDHYTMGPREAAVAAELVGAKRVVPCHWGTFPALTGTPDQLRELAPAGVEIVDVEPGGTIECETALARGDGPQGARDRRGRRARASRGSARPGRRRRRRGPARASGGPPGRRAREHGRGREGGSGPARGFLRARAARLP